MAGLDLRRLEFTLTTKCNSECIYCQANASPLKNDVMDVQDAHTYLIEASTVSKLESFMVFGGEPMLFPDLAIAIFAKAHHLNVPRISMLTNGFWGSNRKRAEELAAGLVRSGLNEMGISVDAFHSQFIPLKYPRIAAEGSVTAGIKEVVWNVAVIESLNSTNKYDKKTSEILKSLESVGIDAHVHRVLPVGRAIRNLRRYFQQESLEGPCAGDPVLKNVLTNPSSITVEPSGEANICWNLSIGNAREKPLSQIMQEYNWRENSVIQTLVEEGPIGLWERTKEQRLHSKNRRFLSKCHLCIEIRKSLKKL